MKCKKEIIYDFGSEISELFSNFLSSEICLGMHNTYYTSVTYPNKETSWLYFLCVGDGSLAI
jgi:hypothetical protein